MLFIITYDEHGGFYDHFPTPTVGVPSPDGLVGSDTYKFQFDRLSVRVPTIMISPWIERGTVVHKPSRPDPTSIPARVKKIFSLNEILTKRDAWASTFESVISRNTPRTDCPVTLPDPQKIRPREVDDNGKLGEFQEELKVAN
ncbi:hypothetical protein C5167_028032 [Papaver somniferum]|nr:hypothetical protein C5167_028032 [Papaver somniferum]